MTVSEPDLVCCRSQIFPGKGSWGDRTPSGSGRCRHTLRLSLPITPSPVPGSISTLLSSCRGQTKDCTGALQAGHKIRTSPSSLEGGCTLSTVSHWCTPCPPASTHHLCQCCSLPHCSGCFPAPGLAEEKGRKTKHQQWKSGVNADWWDEIQEQINFQCLS